MLNEHVLDALLSIGVPDDKARAAAISLAGYEPQIAALRAEVAALDTKVTMLQWGLGLNISLTIGVVVKLWI